MLTKCVLFLILFTLQTESKRQTVKVTGRLVCCERAQKSGTKLIQCNPIEAKVELKDHNLFSADDILATTESDSDGKFQLSASKEVFTNIEAYLLVTHQCNVTQMECTGTTLQRIPPANILSGKQYMLDPFAVSDNKYKKETICTDAGNKTSIVSSARSQ